MLHMKSFRFNIKGSAAVTTDTAHDKPLHNTTRYDALMPLTKQLHRNLDGDFKFRSIVTTSIVKSAT